MDCLGTSCNHSTMRNPTVNIYYCAVSFLLLTTVESLRCRSGNQRSNDHAGRIMQACRKKYSTNGNNNANDYSASSENNSSDEDSDSGVSLDEEFFFGNTNKRSNGNSSRKSWSNGQSSNGSNGENRRNDRHKHDSYRNNRMSNPFNYTRANERGNGMSNQNENRNYRSGMESQNSENNNHRDRTECVTQCFFEELNAVDQGGFPERGHVTELMTRGIQDPSVRDFVEESIFECFHYLESDANNHEKCTFSNNLMNCYADKGRDRCEDWDD